MKRARRNRRKPRPTESERLLRILVTECGSLAGVLEAHYWSKEPGLIEIMRGIALMPEDTRAALEAFIALARETKSVTARLDQRGVLTLASVEAARTVALAQYAAAKDVSDSPHLLN
jgi:hypothetical protein